MTSHSRVVWTRIGLGLILAFGIGLALVVVFGDRDEVSDASAPDAPSDTGAPGVASNAGVPDAPQRDPVSSTEFEGTGFAVRVYPPTAALPEFSHAAIVATVLDVLPPVLNTPSGGVPDGRVIDDFRRSFSRLAPATPVRLAVEEVLAVNPRGSLEVVAGSELVVFLAGGSYEAWLSDSVMRALGVFEDDSPDDDFDDDTADARSGGRPPGVFSVMLGLTPSADLAEGDRVLLFLGFQDGTTVSDDWEVGTAPRLVIVGSGAGAFKLDGSGLAYSTPLSVEGVTLNESDVRQLAELLADFLKPPRDLDELIRSAPSG